MHGSGVLEKLQTSLATQKELLSCLKERIGINDRKINKLQQGSEPIVLSLDDRERINEIFISSIKTRAEIVTLEGVIKQKEEYFKKYAEDFERDLLTANLNWDNVIGKARKMLAQAPHLKELSLYLKALDAQADINADVDKKVSLYKRIAQVVGV